MLGKCLKYVLTFSCFIIACIGIHDYYEVESIFENNNIESSYHYQEIAKEKPEETRLVIPKISFARNLYNDSRNDLEKNIIFIDGSSMPDEKNGNVIIAGHNGNSNKSFFRELHKLSIGDEFYIYYKGEEYKYKIKQRYLVKKTGEVEIRRDRSVNSATLITCHKKDKQLVFIAELET